MANDGIDVHNAIKCIKKKNPKRFNCLGFQYSYFGFLTTTLSGLVYPAYQQVYHFRLPVWYLHLFS